MLKEDFDKLTYWLDYDRPLLKELTEEQKILYFEKRIERTVLIPIGELYTSLMKNKKDNSTLLCFALCTCCALGTLGRFYNGYISYDYLDGDAVFDDSFKDFIETYMKFPKKYIHKFCENFRKSLIYDFAIKNGGFEFQPDYFSIKVIEDISYLIIDPSQFYSDFTNSVSAYISDLKAADVKDTIRFNFKQAFNNL